MTMKRRAAQSAAAAFVLASASAAAAADAPAASATPQVEEIIVTAQKRSEDINHVPITMSVLTGSKIEALGVNSTQQLEIATPGLVFGDTNGFAQPFIRGIGTDLITPGQESPVAFYLDGVYLPLTSSLLQEFGDIARVEVLKGPQGTLYGRNTTGGAINIITRDPGDTPEADLSATYGEYNTKKLVGYVGGPIAPGLSASLSGVFAQHDGFFTILNTGDKEDNENQKGIRGKIKYQPNDTFSLVLSADETNKDDSSASVFTTLVGSALTPLVSPPGNGPSFQPRTAYLDPGFLPHRYENDWGLNATARLHLDGVDLTSITGYRHDYLRSTADDDGTSSSLLSFFSKFGSRNFTEELQVASNGSGRLQWIVGAYYLDGHVFADPVYVWSMQPVSQPPGTIIIGTSAIQSYAAFGQASYALTDSLKITGGLRYSLEKRQLTSQSLDGFNVLDPNVRALFGLGAVPPDSDDHSLDPKVTLQYDANGQMLYATFSKGFKSGSYNLISLTNPGPLLPEKITAYEIGGKHRLGDTGAHLNWSAFYYDYKNIQVNVQDPGIGAIVSAQNAASTTNKGIDVDLVVPVTPALVLTFGGEYLDARYDSFPNASVYNIVGRVLGVTPNDTRSEDVSGNRAERSPKFTTTAQAAYTIPTSYGDFVSTASWYHNSGFFFDTGNQIKQSAFDIVNLNIRYTTVDGHYSLGVFANNAFNKTVVQGINETPYGIFGNYNAPRIIGGTISAKF